MAVYPDVKAGQRITADLLRSMIPQVVYKTAHTDRASTTTLTADPDLTLELEASAVYVVEFTLYLAGAVANQTDWSVPSGSTGYKGCQGPGSSATSDNNISMRSGAHNFDSPIAYGYRSSDSQFLQFIQETGTVTTVAAGTLAVRWAQNSSSATASRMGNQSWLRVTRIG